LSTPEGNQDKGPNENKESKEPSENLFKILDDLLAHMNSSRRLILLFIGSALFFAPVALGLGGILLGHPTYGIRHLGGIENSANMPLLRGAHLQLVSQNGTIISQMPLQPPHPQRSGLIFLAINVFIVISIIFAGILLFIAVKEYRFLSRWNKRYAKFRSMQDKIDKELGED
jgi:hypothetical protein